MYRTVQFSENVTRLVASRVYAVKYITARSLVTARTTCTVNARREVSDHFRTDYDIDTSLVVFCSARQRRGGFEAAWSSKERLVSRYVISSSGPSYDVHGVVEHTSTCGCNCQCRYVSWNISQKERKALLTTVPYHTCFHPSANRQWQ